jgi:hypothetical protein
MCRIGKIKDNGAVVGGWKFGKYTGLAPVAHLHRAKPIHCGTFAHEVRKDHHMAFPPNYSQERKAREAAKQRKAREKLEKRGEKSADRRHESEPAAPPPDAPKEDI